MEAGDWQYNLIIGLGGWWQVGLVWPLAIWIFIKGKYESPTDSTAAMLAMVFSLVPFIWLVLLLFGLLVGLKALTKLGRSNK